MHGFVLGVSLLVTFCLFCPRLGQRNLPAGGATREHAICNLSLLSLLSYQSTRTRVYLQQATSRCVALWRMTMLRSSLPRWQRLLWTAQPCRWRGRPRPAPMPQALSALCVHHKVSIRDRHASQKCHVRVGRFHRKSAAKREERPAACV